MWQWVMFALRPTCRLVLRTSLLQPRKFISVMPSSNPEAKNACGLTPAESKSLKERVPEAHEQPIVQAIKEVSSLTSYLRSMRRY